MKFSTLGLTFAALGAWLSLIPVTRLEGQAKGSLSELDIENSRLKVNLEKALEENKQLSDALAENEKTLADMRSSARLLTGECEVFKREVSQYKLRMEALGLDPAASNTSKLEQRLVDAVNDLRTMAEEKKNLSEALVRLTEASSLFAKTATGPNTDARVALEAEIRHVNAILGAPSRNAVEVAAVPATISDGVAISLRDDLALVVVNLGSIHGVKLGMSFQVIRGDHIVGTVRVVDVREKISGAVIQSLTTEKDRVKVGDRLKVEAHR